MLKLEVYDDALTNTDEKISHIFEKFTSFCIKATFWWRTVAHEYWKCKEGKKIDLKKKITSLIS